MSAETIRRRHSDRGSGGALVLGLVGGLISVIVAVLPLGAAVATARRASAASDAAALAAADTLLGVVPGDPCGWAARVATAHDVALTGCRVDGVEAVVTVRTAFGALPVESSSRAGAPR